MKRNEAKVKCSIAMFRKGKLKDIMEEINSGKMADDIEERSKKK